MKTNKKKTSEKNPPTAANSLLKMQSSEASTFLDKTTHETQLKEIARVAEPLQGKVKPIQEKSNKTGLPDNLKFAIQNLSGYSIDDVKVHYNASKPAQIKAHAYAQGTAIHFAPGQEKHLPHEAWHDVQQKQGKIQPTLQIKDEIPVNDDAVLEREADVLGAKSMDL